MSEYKINIKAYHAISSADISLKGITVLTGVNGSGKSTIAKWLYYIVDGAVGFDAYAFQSFQKGIHDYLERLLRAYREMLVRVRTEDKENFHYSEFLDFLLVPANHDTYQDKYRQVIYLMGDDIAHFIEESRNKNIIELRVNRVKRYLDIPDDISSGEEAKRYFIDTALSYLDDQINQYRSMLDNRSKDDFLSFIHDEYRETDSMPEKISLDEDGVNMLADGALGRLLNINRVVYIDSPIVFRGISSVSPFWNKLNRMLRTKIKSSNNTTSMLLRIRRILRGKFQIEKNTITDSNELHYMRNDGLDIPIDKTATGFRSFAYLQLLLENGYLDENTILLIDEPEAHLHPQWIVEYARLIVLLYKEFGVKIMLASHNPDMVSAIYNISKREKIAHDVKFYLSQAEKDGYSFRFVDQKGDIEGIFKSFNIALDRINQYGGLNEADRL